MLLVEDADDIRDAYDVLLRSEGACVVATSTGRDALASAVGKDFHVLLTDLGLPDIPGDMLIREVLVSAATRPRVIVVTGYGEPYVGRARAAGANVVLSKPLEWTVLLDHLQAASLQRVAA